MNPGPFHGNVCTQPGAPSPAGPHFFFFFFWSALTSRRRGHTWTKAWVFVGDQEKQVRDFAARGGALGSCGQGWGCQAAPIRRLASQHLFLSAQLCWACEAGDRWGPQGPGRGAAQPLTNLLAASLCALVPRAPPPGRRGSTVVGDPLTSDVSSSLGAPSAPTEVGPSTSWASQPSARPQAADPTPYPHQHQGVPSLLNPLMAT